MAEVPTSAAIHRERIAFSAIDPRAAASLPSTHRVDFRHFVDLPRSERFSIREKALPPRALEKGKGAMRSVRGIAAIVVVLAIPAVVFAVDVRGTLTIPSGYGTSPQPDNEQRVRYWEEWNGVLEARTPRIDIAQQIAVVLTGSGPVSTGEQPPYQLHNGALAPQTLVARAGTAIQIRNDDGIPYELFAEGNQEFGPIQTAPGNARPITLSAPGNWSIRDRIHPHIRGHLHALPNLVARAFVESNGAYVFRGVAPGTYQLHVFDGPREVITQEVVVGEGGQLTVPAIALSIAPPSAPSAAGAQP